MRKNQFDGLIKAALVERDGAAAFGYAVGGKVYENYYSRQAFAQFVAEMQAPEYLPAHNAFGAGKGSELCEHSRLHETYPPKMASVASSSRFCYLALRDGAEVLGGKGQPRFEHACRIEGITGTAPQLDACFTGENIFVEAKCHEIFDQHQIKMRMQYWELLHGVENAFGLPALPRPEGEYFTLPLTVFGVEKSSAMFDVKQLLCHLLGIASQKCGKSTLVYLFFKPKSAVQGEQEEIEQLFAALQEEIKAIFASAPIQHFLASHQIALRAVAEEDWVMGPLTSANLLLLAKA